MLSLVDKIADDAFVLLITLGHSTDSPILTELLCSKKFPYLGVSSSEAEAI